MQELELESALGTIQLVLNYLRELTEVSDVPHCDILRRSYAKCKLVSDRLVRRQQEYIHELHTYILRKISQKCAQTQTQQREQVTYAFSAPASHESVALRAELYEARQLLQDETLRYTTLEFRYKALQREFKALKDRTNHSAASVRDSTHNLAKMGASARRSLVSSVSGSVQTDVTGQRIAQLEVENLALSSYMERLHSLETDPEGMQNHWLP